MSIVVRKYGLLSPLDWGDDCREHLFMANDFWNRLVAIEHTNRSEWSAVFERDLWYANAKTDLNWLCAQIEKAWDARKADRARLRAKATPEDQSHEDRIKALSARRAALWTAMKKRRNALKAELREELDAIEETRKARVKAARQAIAAEGLYWGTYNAVAAAYQTARVRALKDGVQLKFHAFTGEGRFVNQIQGGMSVDDLFVGRHSQVKLSTCLPPEIEIPGFSHDRRDRARLRLLTATVYTGKDAQGRPTRRNIKFPLIYSRDLPPEGRIKDVAIICRKQSSIPTHAGATHPFRAIRRGTMPTIADRYEWSAVFTLALDAEAPASSSSSACGINLGWRQTKGGLRVATVVGTDGLVEHYHLPESVLRRLKRCEQYQSELDDGANAIREHIAAWLDEATNAPAEWREAAVKAARSRSSHEPLYRLALLWIDWDYRPDWRAILERWQNVKRPKPGEPDFHVKMAGFMNCDCRKRQEAEGLRRKAINYRREFYQTLAKRLTERYAIIGTGQLDLKQAALLVVADAEDTDLPAIARSNRQKASLSELTEWLGKQAAKTGSQIVEAHRPVTNTCHACGEKQAVKPDELIHICTKCGERWDRDINAATIALQDASGSARKKSREAG